MKSNQHPANQLCSTGHVTLMQEAEAFDACYFRPVRKHKQWHFEEFITSPPWPFVGFVYGRFSNRL